MAALCVVGVASASANSRSAGATKLSGRAILAGTAAPAYAREHPVGAVSRSSVVRFDLVLRMRDPAGALALLRAVSTPGSASYRHYLTASQWEARFSPTASEVAQASAWLRSQGFTVGAVSRDRLTIAAAGTAAQVESAFSTKLGVFRVAGHLERLATGNLSMPAVIAHSVVGAMGVNQTIATAADLGNPDVAGAIHTASSAKAAGVFPPAPGAFVTAPPCSSSYGSSTTTTNPAFGHGYPATVPDVVCGYKPGQLRSAYGIPSTATGSGVTVAIVDAYGSATIAADATNYFKKNDPGNPFANADFQQIDQTPFDHEAECAASSWLTEQAIDVEAVHSMAPNAHILYVGAQDCVDGLFTADQTVIDNGLANIVTNSWADLGGDLTDDVATRTAFDDLFMLGDTTGISTLFSSGDDGDNFYLLGFSAANYPSESPFVTAVGGTSLQIGANGQRVGEVGWDTGRSWLCTPDVVNIVCPSSAVNTWLPATPDGISGGFTSYNYSQPWYQAPIVPPALSERNDAILGPVPTRVIPDISLDADPGTGFLIGLHEAFMSGKTVYGQTRYGGTSLASPLLAGVLADASQAAGIPVGFINPAIYRLDLNDPSAIYDVVPDGKQGNYRVDHLYSYVPGAPGTITSFRELHYSGLEVYCDATGNCASRHEPLTTTKGYDSLTGLGSPGLGFIEGLAGH